MGIYYNVIVLSTTPATVVVMRRVIHRTRTNHLYLSGTNWHIHLIANDLRATDRVAYPQLASHTTTHRDIDVVNTKPERG